MAELLFKPHPPLVTLQNVLRLVMCLCHAEFCLEVDLTELTLLNLSGMFRMYISETHMTFTPESKMLLNVMVQWLVVLHHVHCP
jgi:hypothetical protein